MSKIRLSTVFFLLFGLCAGIGMYLFEIYAGFVANCWLQISVFSIQIAGIICTCLNLSEIKKQKKHNEKFMKYLGLKFAEDLYNKGEEKE